MGYLSDIIDGVKDAKRSVASVRNEISDAKNELIPHTKTLAGRSMDGTCQFPFLASDTISIDRAATLTNKMERVYASFVQSVVSMNSTIDISVDRSPVDYLKQFHRNVRALESTDEEIGDYMERVAAGEYSAYYNESMDMVAVFSKRDHATRTLLEKYKDELHEAGFTRVPAIPNVGNNPFYEAPKTADFLPYMTPSRSSSRFADDRLKDVNIADAIPTVMKDADVKKLNDMQPYTVSVKLMAVNDKKEFVQFMDFVIGIKAVLHPVKSEEIISNVSRAIANNGFLFKFIRWTTGEISLFKDILFNVTDVKVDAANRSRGSSCWWQTFKRMRERKGLYNNIFSRNKMIPNATLVITSEEASIIRDKSGFDLNDEKIALKLINEMFLMTFIIVDDSSETIKVLYSDAGQSYQYYSLSALEKEVQTNSNTIGKEIVRMISR